MNPPDARFDEPWQAQLFALTVALNEAGQFTWSEWTSVFGPRVQSAEPDAYWQVWADALVELLDRKGATDPAALRAMTARWQAAARATPHGTPIRLDAAPDG